MKKIIALSLFVTLISSIASAFPFGMPPKESPVITKVAIEGSGVFCSWQGTGAADPNSTNDVERFLAKPEIKVLLDRINYLTLEKRSKLIFFQIMKLAIKNGTALYFPDYKVPGLGGLIVLEPGDLATVEKFTDFIKRSADADANVFFSKVDIGKLSLNKFTFKKENVDFYWGTFGNGKVLLFGNDFNAILTIIKNARTPEPKWVTNAKKDFNIKRLSTLSIMFGNPFDRTKDYNNSGDANSFRHNVIVYNSHFRNKILGFNDYIEKTVAASGMDDKGTVQKSAFFMKDGWKNSFIGVVMEKNLSKEDLSVIPGSASFAFAGKTDLNKALNKINEIKGELPEELQIQLAMLTSIVTPFVKQSNDSWAYFTVKENDVPNNTFVLSLKNHAMMKIQLNRLMEKLRSALKNRTEIEIEESLGKNDLNKIIPVVISDSNDDETDVETDDIEETDETDSIGEIDFEQLRPFLFLLKPISLFELIPTEIKKIKIDTYDFWELKNSENDSQNLVIGVVNKKLVFTTKSYAPKYVKFDGANNLSSDKMVEKMMANTPSFLIYYSPDSIIDFANNYLEKITNGYHAQRMTTPPLNRIFLNSISSLNASVAIGCYSKDSSAIRVDVNYSLPIPDWFTTLYLLVSGF